MATGWKGVLPQRMDDEKETSKMRVLVLVTDAYGGRGGIAKFNRDFLMALCGNPRITEVVAIPRIQPSAAEPVPPKLTYVTAGLNSKLKYIGTLLKIIRQNPAFDLIIIGHLNLVPLIYFVRLLVRTPTLLLLFGIDAWRPRGRLFRHCLERVDKFISISEFTTSRFCGWSSIAADRIFLLPCAVNLDQFVPGPKKVELLKRHALFDRTMLMTLGRLESTERAKGFDQVLEVLPELSKQIPNLTYLIAGDGPDKKRLEEKAQSLGVAQRVVFAGFIPEVEKADYYRLADAYVMPSRGEGFGIVFLEAMACGVSVIASKIDGSREAVPDDSYGILVDPGNAEEIKRAIVEVLSRPRGVRPVGVEYFSYDNFERRVSNIVDRIL